VISAMPLLLRTVFSIAFIVETPIPKAKRSGIGKLNNPAKRRI